MSRPSCFIAMPIKKEGTDEFQHYQALYKDHLAPLVEAAGFQVIRADDIQRSGAITRDVIVHLAQADLVIADLTDLNPNVFYEIGIRHSLRGSGTVMILDEERTPDVPFDLGAYRVIKFSTRLAGLGRLRRDLQGFLVGLDGADDAPPDNPVHDWLPTLPRDALASSAESEEGQIRAQLSAALRRIQDYEQQYGPVGAESTAGESPLNVVITALQDAREGTLPTDLVAAALDAADERDKTRFLLSVRQILERSGQSLGPPVFLQLVNAATVLGLRDVETAIFEHARLLHPNDKGLLTAQLAHLAHSPDPVVRERAREEILRQLGLAVEPDGTVSLDDSAEQDAASDMQEDALLGFALDAYYNDGIFDVLLRITEFYVRRYPHRSRALRNHGRSLSAVGKQAEAYEMYRSAVLTADRDDTSALWFGNYLRVQTNRYVDALEAFSLAAKLDPEDGSHYLRIASEVLDRVRDELMGVRRDGRALPAGFDQELCETLIAAGFSADQLDQEDLSKAAQVARVVDLGPRHLERLAVMRRDGVAPPLAEGEAPLVRLNFIERVKLADRLYRELATELTLGPPRISGADAGNGAEAVAAAQNTPSEID